MSALLVMLALMLVAAGTTLLIYAAVQYRHQIINFFGAIANPPLNNWALLGLWIGVVVLFAFVVLMGGGEPLGLSLLRQAAQNHHHSAQLDFYNSPRAMALYSPGYQPPTLPQPQGSWVWWCLFLAWLALAIAFIPIAFHDEIGNAWERAWERFEQRVSEDRFVEPTRVPIGPAGPAPTGAETFWSRFNRRLSEHLPADVIAEIINDFVFGAVRAIFRR